MWLLLSIYTYVTLREKYMLICIYTYKLYKLNMDSAQ